MKACGREWGAEGGGNGAREGFPIWFARLGDSGDLPTIFLPSCLLKVKWWLQWVFCSLASPLSQVTEISCHFLCYAAAQVTSSGADFSTTGNTSKKILDSKGKEVYVLEGHFADGGVIANNPTLAAVAFGEQVSNQMGDESLSFRVEFLYVPLITDCFHG